MSRNVGRYTVKSQKSNEIQRVERRIIQELWPVNHMHCGLWDLHS